MNEEFGTKNHTLFEKFTVKQENIHTQTKDLMLKGAEDGQVSHSQGTINSLYQGSEVSQQCCFLEKVGSMVRKALNPEEMSETLAGQLPWDYE